MKERKNLMRNIKILKYQKKNIQFNIKERSLYMNDILLSYDHDILNNLQESQIYLNRYKPLNNYQSLFESIDNNNIYIAENNNANTINKSKNALKKAFDAIMSFIRNAVESIKNFIARITMSDRERDEFDEFEKIMKSHPELANKKVTVKDYQKIQQQYDEYLKEVEALIREAAKGKKTDAQNLVNKVNTFIKNAGQGAAATLTMNTLLRMSAQNRTVAKDVQMALKNTGGFLQDLWAKSLGEKEADKAVKEIEKCGSVISLTRLKNRLLMGKYETLKECITDTFKHKRNLLALYKTAKKNPELSDISYVAKRTYFGTKKGIIQNEIEDINPLSKQNRKIHQMKKEYFDRKNFYKLKK